MNRSHLIAGGAVGALALLAWRGVGARKAGHSNAAAAAYLREHAAGAGVAFDVPASSSMVEAHRAFAAALKDNPLPYWASIAYWTQIEALWLSAWYAGAQAEDGQVNYALSFASDLTGANSGIIDTVICADWYGDAEALASMTPLGRAVCELRRLDLSEVSDADRRTRFLEVTRELAEQMDAADFVEDGKRERDRVGAGRFFGQLWDAITPSFEVGDVIVKLGMAAIAGLVIWKVATK